MKNKHVEVYSDEAVCFLADRHHISTEEIKQRLLMQDGIIPRSDLVVLITDK